MKFKFLFTFLVCMLLSFSLASGQSVTLESVDGLVSPGVLDANVPITFYLRLQNDGARNAGVTNGFSISSPDGATWGSAVGDTLIPFKSYFDLIASINTFSTGSGADTIGFGGAALGGTGLVANFNEVAYSITIGPLSPGDIGKKIVLDSAFYRPSGTWKWAGPDQFASWDGPHEFFILEEPEVNTPPVLDPIGAQPINEGQELIINVSSSDADGNPLTLTTSTLPSGASFDDNGNGTGVFTWTPGYDQSSVTPYNVTFTVDDGTDTAEELVAITVGNTNRPPVLDSIRAKASFEDVNLNFSVSASDADGTTPSISATGLPTGATFIGTTFDWTPTFDDAGSYDVTFEATDGEFTDFEVVTITVNNVNRPPFLVDIDNQETDEGVYVTFGTSATDPDGNTPTVSATGLPEGATFINGVFEWTPDFDQANTYFVTIEATDDTLTVNDIVTILVNDVPQPPILTEIGDRAVTAGEAISFNVSASDLDGTFPELAAVPLPGTATFVDSGNGVGTFSWSTLVADSGEYDVTFSATDGGFTDDEVVTVTVGEAPKILSATPDSLFFTFGKSFATTDTGTVTVTEINGALIVVDAVESADWMDVDAYTPGTAPQDIKVAAYPLDLPVGMYHDIVTISSADAENTQTIDVWMEITNNAPYIVSPEGGEFETDECSILDFQVVTADDNGDNVTIAMTGLVENMTFVDNGNGTADFSFAPNFSQEGVYPIEIILFDGIDSVFNPGIITVLNCEPGTEGDTLSVATVPAVPGARVTVPVTFANLCDLAGFDISVGWTSGDITLDSATLGNTRLELPYNSEVNNDEWFYRLTDAFSELSVQSPGSGNLVDLHFSLAVGISAGFYPLDFYMEPMYNRDCGGGAEEVRPYFIPGGIVVDTSGNYVCGYVVDPDGNSIAGATVELWDNFPTGTAQAMQDASGNGVFAFADFNTIPFDLYAYQDGYYPGRVENINFAQSGIMIVLTPITEFVSFPPPNTHVDFFCGFNTFKEAPLPVGSVIEAYDPDGVKCGEFVVHTAGEYGFIHVYGDDEFSPEDEGAVADDVIRFYVNGIEATTSGSTVWTEDRDIIEVCLDVPDVTPHSCMLAAGWNLVSWNVDTDVDDIANVLASIDDCIEVVMGFEQGALTYDASLPQFSDLWSVDHLSGYWVKVSCDVELVVLGTPVPSTSPIAVTAGWNLISYLPETSMPTNVALTTIHNDLVVTLGFDEGSGLTYLPGEGEFNDLTSMSSCYGYWVKVGNDGTLIYPDGGADSVSAKQVYTQISSSAGRIDATTSWMNMYAFDLKLDDVQVKTGAEIKAFNTNDALVGSYVMKEDGKFGFMPIYGDDKQTEYVDGMNSGEEFYLTIDGVETNEMFNWTTSGDKVEIKGLSAKTTSDILPTSFGLAQNYPNPFNPSTTINFDIPKTGVAKIEIFNLLGQLIATPFDEVAAAGQHTVMWDGRNEDGKSVASGIYFYRLTADNFTNTKKMTLLK